MNDFINYLNSTNNIGGNTSGSLAEAQVKTRFYDTVKVDRALGSYIANCVITGNHQAFVLTGHAGDGKTSILVQILKSLGKLHECEGIKTQMEYDDFMYIKDMSEIAPSDQVKVLRDSLNAPKSGKTSLLISNTGPLIKTFETLAKEEREKRGLSFTSDDKMELQSTLLTQLDNNKDSVLEIEDFSFVLVNIARVDNVPFSSRILKNILNPSLWKQCADCSCGERCPIRKNYELVSLQFERVSAFIENYYRFLFENDKRMTIRQMVGQISYALTGNLTCQDIRSKMLKEPFFNYNFANLFFGYIGLKPAKDSAQIKGIEQIRSLELDRKALNVDYSLFVNHDYSCFIPEIQKELLSLNSKYRKHYQISEPDMLQDNKKQKIEMQLRMAVRRFYLMYSLADEQEKLDILLNQIYGASYTDYRNLISSKQSKLVLRKMQNIIFEALYIKNTGTLPEMKNELPLTLRREDDVFQNVMIVLGQVNKSDLQIVQSKVLNRFEDVDDKQELYLRLHDKRFRLTLPMFTYFNDLIDGAISSNNNPSLSHGISQLDAMLLDEFGDSNPESEDDCEITVIINTTHGQETECFAFDGEHLCIQ